jgi:beta-glucosidase
VENSSDHNEFKLPDELLLGVATAATHIEGGEQSHNWYRWSEQGNIKDGSHCKVACDHIHHIKEDVDLIAGLGCQTYRMGLEWSRIEPEEGKFSEEGIALYWKELQLLHEIGIRPLVTLWHFSNPLWVEDDGGWTNPKTIDRFLNYVAYVVEKLSTWVTDWITINEPNVYLYFGYFDGIWPPGHKGDISGFMKGASHLCQAHCQAYELIHQLQSDAKVGVAHHLRVFDPANRWPLTKAAVKLTEFVFQGMFLEAMTTGKFQKPLTAKASGIRQGNYADFIGINYYSRDIIKGAMKPGQLFGDREVKKDAPVNDLGWEIYPEGLGRVCEKAWKKYQIPIYITENGTCDAEDTFRAQYIHDHLKVLTETINKGVPVERYYHWSLLDNWEWAEGNSARFGLYHTNYETQERTLRKSGEYFREICKSRVVKTMSPT